MLPRGWISPSLYLPPLPSSGSFTALRQDSPPPATDAAPALLGRSGRTLEYRTDSGAVADGASRGRYRLSVDYLALLLSAALGPAWPNGRNTLHRPPHLPLARLRWNQLPDRHGIWPPVPARSKNRRGSCPISACRHQAHPPCPVF